MPEKPTLREIGDTLHERLLAGDVTASAEIAETFLPVVITRLRRRYPNLDDLHSLDTAVEDAILSYLKRPEQYNPAKLSLAGYLRMSANGDLLNMLEVEHKDITLIGMDQVVELEDTKTEYQIADDFDLEAQVLARLSPLWKRLREIAPDPTDQEIVLLMMEGIRETEAYADVLGILDRAMEEQEAIVKRHKDRLKKALRRALKTAELKENG